MLPSYFLGSALLPLLLGINGLFIDNPMWWLITVMYHIIMMVIIKGLSQ